MTKNSKKPESIYHIVQREWKQEKELRPNRDKYSFLKKLITELLKKTNYREKIEEMDITQFKYLHDSKTDKYHPYSDFGQTQDSKRASPIFKRTSEIKGLDVEYRIPDERGIAELYVTFMKAEDRGIDVKELDELTDLLKAVGLESVLLQEQLDNEELDRLLDSKPKKSKKNKKSTNDALWAIADDMRARKEEGEFYTYREAYQWAADHISKKGVNITAEKLELAYHKARSEGRVK